LAVHSHDTYDYCFWNMKIEAECSPEMVAPITQIAWCLYP